MEEKDLSDYLAAFRRYRAAFTFIFAGLLTMSILVALLLPPVFQSTATILIEEQEIPADLVRSTITTYAAQRLQTISQRVMTRANLVAIIDKFNLYPEEREKRTTDDILDQMRQDIAFQPVSADVIDPRSGRPTQATIAFTLSFNGRNPDLVQRVTNEITSLYLEENLRTRTQRTADTSDFLKAEVDQVGAAAAELEQKLASFKANNLSSLPEQKQFNIQLMERSEQELKEIDQQIRTLKERNFLLDGQLAQISPESAIVSSTGQRIMSSSDRLKALRTEYLGLVARYSAKHPDVLKMKQEIEALERDVGMVDSSADEVRELTDLQAERTALSERYSDGHPDITALDRKIKALNRSIDARASRGKAKAVARNNADNPAYVSLIGQKDANGVEIAGLTRRYAEVKAKISDYEQRVQKSPDVERQYLALVRDLENTSNRYRELKAKQMEAQIAEQLEKKSKGERFSVIEPPQVPEKPIKPKRIVIFVLGFILAAGSAGGYVFAREALDKSVRKVKEVAALAGAPPLAVVPYLQLDDEAAAKTRRLFIVFGLLAVAGVLGLFLVHWLWMPLDVVWFRVLRKVGNIIG